MYFRSVVLLSWTNPALKPTPLLLRGLALRELHKKMSEASSTDGVIAESGEKEPRIPFYSIQATC